MAFHAVALGQALSRLISNANWLLRAFVREQHESGKKLPMDLLGAYVGQKTTIKS